MKPTDPNTPAVPRLALSVPESAKALSIGERAVWSLIAAGELPVVRVGRRTLLRVADLDAFLAARSAPAARAPAEGIVP